MIRPNKKKCVQVTWKNIPKYLVLLSWNNPLMLKGLKAIDLKIIQMYHLRLKWKRYMVCTNWWDSNFFGVGLPLFPVGLLLFARWESWTPVFKILVRALVSLPAKMEKIYRVHKLVGLQLFFEWDSHFFQWDSYLLPDGSPELLFSKS